MGEVALIRGIISRYSPVLIAPAGRSVMRLLTESRPLSIEPPDDLQVPAQF
jgi:hypothetical protein